MNRHEQEIIECRNCNVKFNLAAQYYYDNLCPGCKEEKDPGSNLIPCTVCERKVRQDDAQQAKYVGRRHTEMVPVCSDRCANDANRPPWAP